MLTRFLAEVRGRALPVSRVGNIASGIQANVRGFASGLSIQVIGMVDNVPDNDMFLVEITGESNNQYKQCAQVNLIIKRRSNGKIDIYHGF